MNGKVDIRKIGIAIVGVIAVIFGFLKGTDIEPTTDQTQQQIQQNDEIAVNQAEENTSETVEFEFDTDDDKIEAKEDAKPKTESQKEQKSETKKKKETQKPRSNTDDSKPGNQRLTYEGKDLILTYHAKCRMKCRKISKEEVIEVIDEGKENKRKSNPNDPRCPTIALEDWTEDGQLVRIIVADCDNVAKLVTVIDLKNDYNCHCD